jgi:hypothetical protein
MRGLIIVDWLHGGRRDRPAARDGHKASDGVVPVTTATGTETIRPARYMRPMSARARPARPILGPVQIRIRCSSMQRWQLRSICQRSVCAVLSSDIALHLST